jgi:UDP-4-amino-4,6-dideoxy-N-acetyl-beta-L-altrosamine transaminase
MDGMGRFLPYGRQQIDDDDIVAVSECLRDDYLTTGPRVEAFEAALLEKTGAPYAAACSNGTAALHLAAMALRLGPNDQVVVPTLTFLATANAPHFTGADIVFCDVDPDTGLMTAETLEQALTRAPRARAVFPVHLNGTAVAMPALASCAKARGLAVVEDACHALATTYRAEGHAGTIGDCRYSDMAAFSFHPVKAIAMGEGGAVTSTNRELAERVRLLRNHGMTRSPAEFLNRDLAFERDDQANPWYYEMPEPGLNYRVPDVLCALGISQLKKLSRFVARRRKLAALYDEALAELAPAIRPVPRSADCQSAFHIYVVLIDFERIGRTRAEVMKALRADGIGSQVHYMPVHLQPFYRDREPTLHLPGAEAYYRRILTLPLFPDMSDDEVARVVGALARATGLQSASAFGAASASKPLRNAGAP